MKLFTPGPWKLIDDDMDYIAITDIEQQYGICKLEEVANESRAAMVANAYLITLAPELYRELVAAHKIITNALNVMTSAQTHRWADLNERDRLKDGWAVTREEIRRNTLARARGEVSVIMGN